MNRTIATIGASALALSVMAVSAEAKKVFYDIEGQRYSYETSDPDEVAVARKRIEAANAVDAAKARAEAERAGNPLVNVFGSQAQREAEQAQLRLRQLIAEQDRELAEQRQKAALAAREERRRKEAEEKAAAAQAEAPERSAEASPPKDGIPAPEKVAAAAASPALKSVFFDMESGIKTVMMSDGSIHEEPFDSAMLVQLGAAPEGPGSLSDFVNRLRKARAEDSTGSIRPQVAREVARGE